MPYLQSAGAQSVAVVSPHHLIVGQLVFLGGFWGIFEFVNIIKDHQSSIFNVHDMLALSAGRVVVKICLIISESSVESNKIPKQVGTCFGSHLGVHMSAR